MCLRACEQEEFRARPRLDIIQPLPESCEEISSDALTVRNFQDNECRDYRLGETRKTTLRDTRYTRHYALISLRRGYQMGSSTHTTQMSNVLFSPTEHSEGEPLFYIISPKDVVVAKERDQDDHIDWLLEKKKYEVSVVEC